MTLADFFYSHHWIDIRDWLGVIATAAAAIFAAVSVKQAAASRSEAIREAGRGRAQAIRDATEQRRKDYVLASLRDLHKAVIHAFATRDPDWRGNLDQALLACPLRMPLTRAGFGIGASAEEAEAFRLYEASSRGGMPKTAFIKAVSTDEIARETRELLDPDRTMISFESLQERVENIMRERAERSRREVSLEYQGQAGQASDPPRAPESGTSE